jgi:hypothetical protein
VPHYVTTHPKNISDFEALSGPWAGGSKKNSEKPLRIVLMSAARLQDFNLLSYRGRVKCVSFYVKI